MNKELLEKYVVGTATMEEREEVVAWLDSDEANVREYMALHKLHDITVMNQMTASESQTDADERVLPRRRRLWLKIAVEVVKVAAIVAVLVGIRAIFFPSGNKEQLYQTFYVPTGQRAELTLPDHSRVWLNSHTTITYPLSFDEKQRVVKIVGEAFFKVSHNAEKPFIVQTEQFNVQVLGTEFNVYAYSHSEEKRIDLLKGSVQLSGGVLGSRKYLMKPLESISISSDGVVRSTISDYDYFKWKEGLICFNHETVASIIKKLEIYYDTNIIVKNTHFLNEYYSGKFRVKDGIDQVLKILQIELKFKYAKNEDTNSIVIK